MQVSCFRKVRCQTPPQSKIQIPYVAKIDKCIDLVVERAAVGLGDFLLSDEAPDSLFDSFLQ